MWRLLVLLGFIACGKPDGNDSCTVVDNEDGTFTMSCPDGTEATFDQHIPDDTGSDTATPVPGAIMYGDYTISNSIDLSALEGFSEISGVLSIASTTLPNLDGLDHLVSVGGLHVHDNQALTNLDGLSGLTQVVGDFTIETNPLLQNLYGFQ